MNINKIHWNVTLYTKMSLSLHVILKQLKVECHQKERNSNKHQSNKKLHYYTRNVLMQSLKMQSIISKKNVDK